MSAGSSKTCKRGVDQRLQLLCQGQAAQALLSLHVTAVLPVFKWLVSSRDTKCDAFWDSEAPVWKQGKPKPVVLHMVRKC